MKRNPHHYAVILAGGSGTRFWPLSRRTDPKQFLKITGDRTLFQSTLDRAAMLIPDRNIVIMTSQGFRKQVRAQVKGFRIPAGNILFEPEGKNTAPAICWAAARLHARDKDAVMAVLPSDHLIRSRPRFRAVLAEAFALAEEDQLVTMGIVPTRPETGYGYLKTSRRRLGCRAVLAVDKFTEKPSLSRARAYIKKDHYFWNSGMFVWRCDRILAEFARLLPKMHALLTCHHSQSAAAKIWHLLPNISVDYGILEHARDVAAVKAAGIGWSDLGSWEALSEVLPADRSRNTVKGRAELIGCTGVYVQAGQRLAAVIGCDDLVVVDSDDALLVCRKDRSQQVRDLVERLKKTSQGRNML